jgi:membrane protein DedA with SNARE-associated domain
MPVFKVFRYKIVGVVSWVSTLIFAGYFFGNLPVVKDNFSLAILVIILVSSIFGIIIYFKSKRKQKCMIRSPSLRLDLKISDQHLLRINFPES